MTAIKEWQPIATAPKDGTCLLVWCQHKGAPNSISEQEEWGVYHAHFEVFYPRDFIGISGVTIARWGGEFVSGPHDIPAWWFEDEDFEKPVNPTHWLPLPAAPANAEEASK